MNFAVQPRYDMMLERVTNLHSCCMIVAGEREV